MINSNLFVVSGVALSVLMERGYEFGDKVMDDDLLQEMRDAGRHDPSPPLSHLVNDFTEANSRWTTLRHKGELVGTLGMRYDDLGYRPLSEYLEKSFQRQFGGGTKTRIRADAPNKLSKATGPIIYAGDLWFRIDHRGDPAKTVCFSNLTHSLGFAQWPSATLLYALHWRRDALSGKVDQYGFISGSVRGAQVWTSPPPGRSDTEQISMLQRGDWLSELAYLSNHPEELTDPQVRSFRSGEQKPS